MNLAPLIALCPPGFEIVLADVGSAGGLKDRWLAAREVVSALLFEPRDGGEIKRQGRDTCYPIALGPQAGQATLNITALPNMSSTLQPNRALLESYRKKFDHTRVVSTIEMPVDTLDALAKRDGIRIDAVKVDTQGSELSILQGSQACLESSVFLAEIELSFFQRYVDQPLAGDVIAFMAGHGFELLDFYRLKRYRRLNAAGIGNVSLGGGQRLGRLAYGDALFVLAEPRLIDRIRSLPNADAEAAALKAIISLIVYGKPDMAAHLFDTVADLFEPARRLAVADALKSFAARWWKPNYLHHMFDYLARNV